MPANATITVNDGKSTPESHAFEPSDVSSNSASYVNYAEDFPPGRETLKIAKAVKSGGTIRETTITLMIPNVQTVNGLDTVVNYQTYILRCLTPVSATETVLDSDTGMLSNILLNTNVKKIVERGEWVW